MMIFIGIMQLLVLQLEIISKQNKAFYLSEMKDIKLKNAILNG